MSVLIFIDQSEGHVKKASFEALSYGSNLAEQLGVSAEGVVLGTVSEDLSGLGKYGVKKIHHVNNDALNHLDPQVFAKVIAEISNNTTANCVIFYNNEDHK